MKSCVRLLLALTALCAAASAQAQYPNRPIKFVMAYPPAGRSDVLARPIAKPNSTRMSVPKFRAGREL